MKPKLITKIVDGILKDGKRRAINSPTDRIAQICIEESEMLANEATIYLKMAMICERDGIDKAMEYYCGTHNEGEFEEYRHEE